MKFSLIWPVRSSFPRVCWSAGVYFWPFARIWILLLLSFGWRLLHLEKVNPYSLRLYYLWEFIFKLCKVIRNMGLYLFSYAFLLSKKGEVFFYLILYSVLHRSKVLIFSMKNQLLYEKKWLFNWCFFFIVLPSPLKY